MASQLQSVKYKTGYLDERNDFSIRRYILARNSNSVVARVVARNVVLSVLGSIQIAKNPQLAAWESVKNLIHCSIIT